MTLAMMLQCEWIGLYLNEYCTNQDDLSITGKLCAITFGKYINHYILLCINKVTANFARGIMATFTVSQKNIQNDLLMLKEWFIS